MFPETRTYIDDDTQAASKSVKVSALFFLSATRRAKIESDLFKARLE